MMRDRHVSATELLPTMIKEGGYRSLYKGIVANCLRDVPGWGMYFYSFELLKEKARLYHVRRPNTYNTQKSQLFTTVMAGGTAGCLSWLVSYPMDVIKTHIQVSGEKKTPRIRDVIRT